MDIDVNLTIDVFMSTEQLFLKIEYRMYLWSIRLRLQEQKWIGSKPEPIHYWYGYALRSHEILQIRSSSSPLFDLLLDLFQHRSSLERNQTKIGPSLDPIHFGSCKRGLTFLVMYVNQNRATIF